MSMTREQIEQIPAGFEIDKLVQSFVMGGLPPVSNDIMYEFIKPFSNDIKAAWEVVEHMKRNGFNAILMNAYSHSPQRPFENGCSFENKIGVFGFIGYGETMPLAICRAALLAVQSTSPTHDLP